MSKRIQNQWDWHGLTLPGERGFLLNLSRDYPRVALQCPSSSSSAPGHQRALVLCRASVLCP